ncbi:hypothetical protein HK405_015650 [Cladochytrium tenue]|nr:hypothetical protein HK405_015650 [Cladochytrium tenue]
MKVLIIGAGVSGPVLALALKKAGHSPVLVDKFDPANLANGNGGALDFGDVGGGFTLLHGSLRFLRDLGMLEDVRSVAFSRSTHFAWCRMDGSVVYKWDVVAHKNDDDLKFTAQILRSTLHRLVMTRISREGIPVWIGKSLASVDTSDPSKVVVQFTDGTSADADLVVGADGMHSAVRRSVFGSDLVAKPDGMSGYLGVTTYDKKDGWADVANVRFFTSTQHQKRLAFCRVSDTQAFWEITEFGAAKDAEDIGSVWNTTSSEDLPAEVARLAALVKSWGAPQGIVDAIARSHRLTPLVIYDAPSLETFSKGRVVLIGDAAHGVPPHLGQGLTMAYGDAAVLSEALSIFPDDHERAFRIFNNLRVPHAHAMADRTHKFAAQNFPSSTVARLAGELAMKLMAVVFNSFNLITALSGNYKEEVKKELDSSASKSG